MGTIFETDGITAILEKLSQEEIKRVENNLEQKIEEIIHNEKYTFEQCMALVVRLSTQLGQVVLYRERRFGK